MKLVPRSAAAIAGVVVAALLAAVAAVASVRVHQVTHPPLPDGGPVDFRLLGLQVRSVEFPASDGTNLAGWLLPGRADRPGVILTHDLGETKADLLQLMIALHEAGFTVLAFDFRGHGASAGGGSTLGLEEKRDILGALDYLRTSETCEPKRVGLYGVGMGAHAAVLAAADRRTLDVVVLDGLYPDVRFRLGREVFGTPNGPNGLDRIAGWFFRLGAGASADSDRAADRLRELVGRDVLLVSYAGDSRLAAEIERMYEEFPRQRNTDGAMITLPATRTSGLYGDELDRYYSRIVEFFDQRL